MSHTVQEYGPEASAAAGQRVPVQVISVTSGKGGVGKTNVVANLGLALAREGKRVVILDADLGLGNLDVLLGLVPQWSIEHVLAGTKRLTDILMEGPAGIKILPASSGTPQLTALNESQLMLLQDELEALVQSYDVLLIDTGAGISSNVTFFASAAHEIIVVVSPEPTSLTDAYALMKVLSRQHRERRFRVLINMVKNQREAAHVFRKLDRAAERFLHLSLDAIGFIPLDDYLPLSVTEQRAVGDLFPKAPSSRAFTQLGSVVSAWERAPLPKGTVQFLWHHLLS
ncbi:putative flagellar number regulator FleN [Nitrospira sp. KM1]|uniref:MinD/ParA family protein n=1 Tax=Nitrospira sp. KM1 TaxID=1936990 RepID=UPI0013A70FD3|nr:MinD/ParA family protein [Nitrospira sp. KM1]BCA54799.1 putative flagellar number regulator FleN [Nitrospira sp. KM1]